MKSIFNRTTHIRYSLGDVQYRATGFFYRSADKHYLVTNKHIVRHEHGISPDSLRVVFRPKTTSGQPIPRDIQLFDNDEEPRWLEHPSNENADIAVIPLRLDLGETGHTAFKSQNILPTDQSIQLAGSSAVILGYPERYGAGESNTPIARSGLIASEYGKEFQGKSVFLIDANLQNGMSGSPVLLKPAGLYEESQSGFFSVEGSGRASRLLGIHSGPIDRQGDLELHRVWYARLIREIIFENT